jgi:hypothetical protein
MVGQATREEPSPLSEMEKSVERWVRWFQRDGEEMVGEIELRGATLSQLKQVFAPFPDDPLMYYCYPVETVEQIKLLMAWLDGEVNLEAYEYFVECNALLELSGRA